MKQTITKNEKNIEILNKLITNGFYNGYIGTEKFELLPNRSPNNHRLIGILNNDGKYDLKFDFSSPMNIAAKFLLGFGILVSLFFLSQGNYILAIIFLLLGLVFRTNFKLKEKKEMNLFINKLLEFQKAEEWE